MTANGQDGHDSTQVVLVGISHHTAPVALRERLSLNPEAQRTLLAALTSIGTAEAALLTTCNRLEIYAVADSYAAVAAVAAQQLAELKHVDSQEIHNATYIHTGPDAAEHLHRVACGLDSMVLGESHILGQVADSISAAREYDFVGPRLQRLFDSALHAGKRAHGETSIGRHTVSIAQAAAVLAEQRCEGLAGLNAVIVGSGEMASAACHALHVRGAPQITILNRTAANGTALASRFGASSAPLSELPRVLAEADIVISATAAAAPVISAPSVATAMATRPGRRLLCVDIAVPRDIDPLVGELTGVDLLDIDALRNVVDGSLAQRKAEVPKVERIIVEEVRAFENWLNIRAATPAITALRYRVEAIADSELQRALCKLNGIAPHQRRDIELMVHRIVKKVLHEPTVRLRRTAAAGSGAGLNPPEDSVVRGNGSAGLTQDMTL